MCRAPRAHVPGPAGSTSSPGCLRPLSDGPRCPPALPGISGVVPRARRVYQLSQATCSRLRYPAGSTNTPGRLTLVSEGPRCPPAVPGDSRSGRWPSLSTSCPGDSGPCLRSCGLNLMSRATWGLAPVPAVRTALPRDSGPGPMACAVDQNSRATRAWVCGLTGSTSSPMPLGLGPRACGVHQLSGVTLDRV